jgi:hypothetical protein
MSLIPNTGKLTLSLWNNPQVVVVVLQQTGAPFEVMAELWDFFRRPDRLNASFKARSATLGTVPYFLLTWRVESSPPCRRVTDTSRHRSFSRHFRRCGLPLNIFHICSIAFSIHCSVHHCSLFCSLPITAFCHRLP